MDHRGKNQTGERDFAGRRILVVEDEFLISNDIALALSRLGVSIIGPASTLEGAMRLLESSGQIDGAVLDINLKGKMVFPLADVLQKNSVPFIFATGYSPSAIPERYQNVPHCEKPLDPAKVLRALLQLRPDR